jgi:hypothetical protein
MANDGYLAAGYEYLALDDCWQAPTRTADGHIQSDPKRFPSGIKALADYVHNKGLKFGLYTALGNASCAFPGIKPTPTLDDGLGCDHLSMPACTRAHQDIDDMVSWGIVRALVVFYIEILLLIKSTRIESRMMLVHTSADGFVA